MKSVTTDLLRNDGEAKIRQADMLTAVGDLEDENEAHQRPALLYETKTVLRDSPSTISVTLNLPTVGIPRPSVPTSLPEIPSKTISTVYVQILKCKQRLRMAPYLPLLLAINILRPKAHQCQCKICVSQSHQISKQEAP